MKIVLLALQVAAALAFSTQSQFVGRRYVWRAGTADGRPRDSSRRIGMSIVVLVVFCS